MPDPFEGWVCQECGNEMPPGPGKLFCGKKCRQKNYRRGQAALKRAAVRMMKPKKARKKPAPPEKKEEAGNHVPI